MVPQALRCGEIRPVFQPIVAMQGRALAGFEVLARWTSPHFGAIAPEAFIHWAEEDGSIDALTHALLRAACTEAAGWGDHFFLCVNISPLQFSSRNFAPVILAAVEGTGFPRRRLVVEMTEKHPVSDSGLARETIRRLAGAGVRLALDDFGTGHSGLARLLGFPFDTLKIDKRVVHAIDTDAGARNRVSALIALAARLGIDVVAEGVERREQAAILDSLGCTYGQGWLLGREMTPGEAGQLARDHAAAPGGGQPE